MSTTRVVDGPPCVSPIHSYLDHIHLTIRGTLRLLLSIGNSGCLIRFLFPMPVPTFSADQLVQGTSNSTRYLVHTRGLYCAPTTIVYTLIGQGYSVYPNYFETKFTIDSPGTFADHPSPLLSWQAKVLHPNLQRSLDISAHDPLHITD